MGHLRPSAYNPREITDEAREGLTSSLEQFGDIAGVCFNVRSGRLITGHQRVAALRDRFGDALYIEDDVILVKGRAELAWPVRIVDWPREREMVANVTANNPHVAGEFDADALGRVLDELQTGAEWGTVESLLAELKVDDLVAEIIGEDVPDDSAGRAGGTKPAEDCTHRVMVWGFLPDRGFTRKEQRALMRKLKVDGYACQAVTS